MERRPPCRPKPQARSAVHEEHASPRQGRLPPQIWAPTEHRPPSLNSRCRAARAQGATGSFINGGMTSVSSQDSGAQRRPRGACESQTRAAPAAEMGADGASPSKSQLALPRRLRAGRRRVVHKWRDDLRVVPSLRRAAPSATSVRVGNRFLPFEGESQTRAAAAAKVGPRRRGVPTIYFRVALPRRLRVRRPLRSKW